MRPLAAITMAYNEHHALPRWLRHYGAQVGLENCFVLDHGSEDHGLGPGPFEFSFIRLPRTPLDEHARCVSVSDFASALAGYYRYVLYADADELVVVDPNRHASLAEYAATLEVPLVNSIGFDICEREGDQPVRADRPVSEQRNALRFHSSLCKASISRPGVRWTPGFHGCQHEVHFDAAYLFHTHWCDRTQLLERLKYTRDLDMGEWNPHWRIPDGHALHHIQLHAEMPLLATDQLSELDQAASEYMDYARANPEHWNEFVAPAQGVLSDKVFTIPAVMRGKF